MGMEWYKTESTVEPQEFDFTSSQAFALQHKDIVRVEDAETGSVMFKYYERRLPPEVAIILQSNSERMDGTDAVVDAFLGVE